MTNVVFVLADDMREDLLPYMPWTNGFLRPGGTYLSKLRCEVPICSPARASILTGRHARDAENLVYDNSGNITNAATHSLPVWLQSVTAANAVFGKYLVAGAGLIQPGWDRWCVMSASTQEAYTYTMQQEDASTSQPGLSSPYTHQLQYLKAAMQTYLASVAEPFFLWFCPTNPHSNATEFTNNPFPETVSKFGWWNPPFNHQLSGTDAATKPSFRTSVGTDWTAQKLAKLRAQTRNQVREVFDLDGVFKSMYDALAARGGSVLSNTVFIFATDSGVYWEEQRLGTLDSLAVISGKNEPFEFISRVPSIIYGPAQGIPVDKVADTPMILQDITATILALLGGTATVTQRGTDIRTLISSPPANRDTLYERGSSGLAAQPDATGIVDRTRKLIKYVGQTAGDTYEMYDLDTDPNEYVNVANDGARLTERNALETRMGLIA